MDINHPRFPSKTTFISIETLHQNLNRYEKINLNHPFNRRSGGGLGAEARQENREIGEALQRSLPADRVQGDCGKEKMRRKLYIINLWICIFFVFLHRENKCEKHEDN